MQYNINNLVLNSTKLSNIYNTQFTYNFIQGAFIIAPNSEMCVSQITMPFSWFNLNATVYNNTTFQYRWYNTGGSFTTYTVVIPNGNYSVADINNYLQLFMISQNQYLVNATTGYNYYFINLITDATYYSNQLIVYPVPTSLPSGYTAPDGFVYSTLGYCPQVIIPSNNFGSIIGYIAGTYPASPQTTSYNTLGTITPNASPVNSLIVLSNIVDNPVSSPTNLLDTFPINVAFGNNINYTPFHEKWISISAGRFTQMVISIIDQTFNAIQANDPNILISLLIRQPKKSGVEPNILKRLNPLRFMEEEEMETD